MFNYDSEEKIDKDTLRTVLFTQFGKKHEFYDYIVDQMYEVFKGYSIKEVGDIINGAKKKMILVHEDGFLNLNHFGKVKEIIDDILTQKDFELYNKINKINRDLKKSLKSKEDIKGLTETMKKLWEIISNSNKKINKGLQDFSKDSLKIFESLASIYSVLVDHLGKNINKEGKKEADEAILRIAEKLGTNSLEKFDSIQIKNINNFLTLVIDEQDPNLFKQEEMLSLISQAPSILASITVEKYKEVSDVIKSHLILMEHKYGVSLNKKAKNVILNSGTILESKKENLIFASTMLLGGNINDALKRNGIQIATPGTQKEKVIDDVYSCCGNIRIQGLDLDINNYFMEHPTFMARLNVKYLYSRIDDITNCLCRAYSAPDHVFEKLQDRIVFLKKIGFDVETMIHKDNIVQLCDRSIMISRKKKTEEEILDAKNDMLTANVKILSKIIPAEEVHKILSHNIMFLLQKPEDLEKQIKKIAKSSKSFNKFKEKINEFVNKVIALEQKVKVDRKIDSKISTKTKTKTSSSNDTFKTEEISIENFVIDNEFLSELGFEVVAKPENKKETTKEDLYKEISTELDAIYHFYDLKSKESNNSMIVSSIIDVLASEEREKGNLTDIKLLAKVSILEKKLKKYLELASEEEIKDIIEKIEHAQYSVNKQKENLTSEIEIGKEIVMDSYATIKKHKPDSSSKEIDNLIKVVKGKSKLLNSLGLIDSDAVDRLNEQRKKSKNSEDKITQERKELKIYSEDLLNNKIVLKVYEKLDKVLSNINNNLVSKKSAQIDKEEIIKRIKELEDNQKTLRQKLESLEHSIDFNRRVTIHYGDDVTEKINRKTDGKVLQRDEYKKQLKSIDDQIKDMKNLID